MPAISSVRELEQIIGSVSGRWYEIGVYKPFNSLDLDWLNNHIVSGQIRCKFVRDSRENYRHIRESREQSQASSRENYESVGHARIEAGDTFAGIFGDVDERADRCHVCGLITTPAGAGIFCGRACRDTVAKVRAAYWRATRENEARQAREREEAARQAEGPQAGWIYCYYVESLNKCYIGQDSSEDGGRRLHTHERGRFPTTADLNREAAEIGAMPKSLRFSVDCQEKDLNWWERHYADKYRNAGWTLVNRTYLTNERAA